LFSFDYSVRLSKRARRARIIVRPNLSVEVVLPQGAAEQHAYNLVQEKRDWVERSLQRFAEQAGDRVCSQPFPEIVELPAIDHSFKVSYNRSGSGGIRIIESGAELHLSGAVDDQEKVGDALRRWLRRKAKAGLVPMLESLAIQHRFRHGRVTLRLQKSRWGSCSKSGNISLNARLLFLPPHLVRYVMLHELAHLKRMDHSPAFWAIVARCDSGYMQHRREMRRVSGLIPLWAED